MIRLVLCAVLWCKLGFVLGKFTDNEIASFEKLFTNAWKGTTDKKENIDVTVDPIDRLLPPLWEEILPLRKGAYPIDREGKLIVNAWDYKQRMSLYKYLVENVQSCVWETDKMKQIDSRYHPGNLLWGLPLQHGWQYSSGRLLTAPNSTLFTSDAWWGNMNFYLSVIPYYGAVQAKLAPSISLAYNPNNTLFCGNPEDCPELVQPWTDFFTLVQTLPCTTNTTTDTTTSSVVTFPPPTPIADYFDYNLTYPMERLLQSLWKAHIHSITTALPLFNTQLQSLSPPEQLFALSWSNLVDFIADSLFPCNVIITNWLQNCLPHRILLSNDIIPPYIEDMSRLENRGIVLIDSIYHLDERLHGLVSRVWKQMMCTEQGRAHGRKLLIFGIYRPILLVEETEILLQLLLLQEKNDDIQCGVFPY